MRVLLPVLLILPAAALGQTAGRPQPTETDTIPINSEALGVALPAPTVQPARAPRPLAANEEERLLNKNEAYNVARAAEGRVGVRLGDDMSYRITGK